MVDLKKEPKILHFLKIGYQTLLPLLEKTLDGHLEKACIFLTNIIETYDLLSFFLKIFWGAILAFLYI